MTNFLKKLSIKRKLMLIIMSVSSLAIVIAGCVFVIFEWFVIRQQIIDSLSSKTQMLAENCKSSLAFDDADDASIVLASSRVEPSIELACIYRPDGTIFATYQRDLSSSSNFPQVREEGYYFDQSRLLMFKQIVLNLVANAIKFTPEGGKVTLKVWSHPSTGHVFQVIDTGIGVALDDIPNILKPFVQIESSYSRNIKGTGLGLPLCKNFIELHGGYLDFQSELGAHFGGGREDTPGYGTG